MAGSLPRLAYGVTPCPDCGRLMTVSASGYGCAGCWSLHRLDLSAAPAHDLRLALDAAREEVAFAEERLRETQAALRRWEKRAEELGRALDARLPTTAALTGSDPGFTGDLSTEEFLRQQRGG